MIARHGVVGPADDQLSYGSGVQGEATRQRRPVRLPQLVVGLVVWH
jgi:hypothetical protein